MTPLAARPLRWLSAALIIAGGLILFFSEQLMFWLIHLAGEEKALGAENVVPQGDRILLTNPGAMFLWTLPFLALGGLLVIAGVCGLWVGWSRGQKDR